MGLNHYGVEEEDDKGTFDVHVHKNCMMCSKDMDGEDRYTVIVCNKCSKILVKKLNSVKKVKLRPKKHLSL